MITRGARLCLEFFVGLAAVVGLLAVLFVWRLSEEPLSIDFVKPHVEAAFLNEETGTRIETDHIFLQWDQTDSTLEVLAQGLRAFDGTERLIASLPSVDVRLAWSALLAGVVAPQSIEIHGAQIRLERTVDGELAFADERRDQQDEQQSTEGQSPPPEVVIALDDEPRFSAAGIRGLLNELMRAPDPRRPFSYLERVFVTDGRIRLVDLNLGKVFDSEDTSIELQRLAGGLQANLSLNPVLGGKRPTVAAAVRYEPGAERFQTEFAISNLVVGDLAGLDSGLTGLAGVEIPVTAEGRFDLSLDGKLKLARFGFDAKPGQAFLPKLFGSALPVSLLSGFMIYDAGARRVTLNPLRVSFGTDSEAGPAFTASANLELRDNGLEVAAELKGANVQVADLATYWPLGVAEGGRSWVVENITAGSADDLSLSLKFGIGEEEGFVLREIDGGFAFDGMEIHYLRPLPPVTEGTGRVRFKPTGLVFEVASARRGNLRVPEGIVDMPNLGADEERVDVTFKATGPVGDALALLDHPRLNLISRLGVQHDEAAGSFTADVDLSLPMIDDLPAERISVSAKADIADAALADFIMSQPLSDGQLSLEVSNEAMSLAGEASIGEVPLSLQWREAFSASANPKTNLTATIPLLDDADRARFGFDAMPYLFGPISIELQAVGGGGEMAIDFLADLRDAGLAMPEMKWRKEAGVAGRATGRVLLNENTLARVEEIVLVAGDLRLSGALDFLPDGNIERLDFARLAFGRQSVSGLVVEPFDGGYRAVVQSGIIDLSQWLESRSTAGESAADDDAETRQRMRDGQKPVDIELTAPQVERVYFAEDRYLSDVSLELERKNGAWVMARLKGNVDPRFAYAGDPPEEAGSDVGETDFALNWGPAEGREDDYRLDARMSDLGAFLRAIDLYDEIEGGSFAVNGQSAGPFPEQPVSLTVDGGDYRLVEAPVMARVLAAASLTGLGNLLSGEGINFDRLEGSAVYHELQFQDIEARTHGSSLGVTTKGDLDLDQDTLALLGEIVPAYTLNNAVSGIPIIGNLLTGGEGGGIIAFTYGVEGAIEDPDVTVNPLAALTPGFLRNIFLIEPGAGDQNAANPDADGDIGPAR